MIFGESAYLPKFSLKSCPDVATESMNCDSRNDMKWFDSQRIHHLRYNGVIRREAFNRSDVWYYDVNDFLCPKGKCNSYNEDGYNLFMDDSHFSYRGSRLFGRDMLAAYGRVPDIFDTVFSNKKSAAAA